MRVAPSYRLQMLYGVLIKAAYQLWPAQALIGASYHRHGGVVAGGNRSSSGVKGVVLAPSYGVLHQTNHHWRAEQRRRPAAARHGVLNQLYISYAMSSSLARRIISSSSSLIFSCLLSKCAA